MVEELLLPDYRTIRRGLDFGHTICNNKEGTLFELTLFEINIPALSF